MKIDEQIFDTVILAGGNNSRMQGRFKGSLTYQGEMFLERIMKGIDDGFGQIFLSCAVPGQVRDIPKGCTVIYDAVRDMGPIAGLMSGFMESNSEYVAVCACDMPFISRRLYAYLWTEGRKLADNQLPDVILPRTKDCFHPLAALYRRSVLIELEQAVSRGERKLMQVIWRLSYKTIELAPLSRLELEVTNVNTLEEFCKLQQYTDTYRNNPN